MRKCLAILPVLVFLTGCSTLDAINPFAAKGPKMAELKPFKATAEARVIWRESVGKAGDYPSRFGDFRFCGGP